MRWWGHASDFDTPSDRFAIFGSRGMVGSAISRAELDLLDPLTVQYWFREHQPTVVVLDAAKVGRIDTNSTYPADFLLKNYNI